MKQCFILITNFYAHDTCIQTSKSKKRVWEPIVLTDFIAINSKGTKNRLEVFFNFQSYNLINSIHA